MAKANNVPGRQRLRVRRVEADRPHLGQCQRPRADHPHQPQRQSPEPHQPGRSQSGDGPRARPLRAGPRVEADRRLRARLPVRLPVRLVRRAAPARPPRRALGRARCRRPGLAAAALDPVHHRMLAATPLTNSIIRINEVEADAFGLDAAREPDGFAHVAMRLSEYRKLEPGHLEEIVFFDHPSGYNRARHVDGMEGPPPWRTAARATRAAAAQRRCRSRTSRRPGSARPRAGWSAPTPCRPSPAPRRRPRAGSSDSLRTRSTAPWR